MQNLQANTMNVIAHLCIVFSAWFNEVGCEVGVGELGYMML